MELIFLRHGEPAWAVDGVPDVYLCGFGRADYLFFGEKDSTPVTATPWSKTKQFYR